MAYQEKKTIGYGTRVSNSAKGIGTGFILLLAGTVMLWWNEGRAVKTSKMLEEAQGVTVHVDDVSETDPSLNGKLIHATAFTATKDSLIDAAFGIGAVAIKLERRVEYYQWVENAETETKDKIGGSQEQITTYTYNKEWVGKPVKSAEFKDPAYQNSNFTVMDLEDKSYVADNVTFGAYRLPKNLINTISDEIPMELNFSQEQLKQWNGDVKTVIEDMVMPRPDSLAQSSDIEYVHVNNNVLYFGKSPNNPQIGDVSVTFTKVLPGESTVIAQVNGNRLQSFVAKSGKTFSVLTTGAVGLEEMYQNEHKSNSTMTWILRMAGLVLVILGFKGIFGILTTLLQVLPFLADIVGLGVSLVCGVLGFVWSLLVIALAWLFYRPLIAAILLAVVIGLIVYLVKRGKDKKKSENPAV